jgi:hypothetical protein
MKKFLIPFCALLLLASSVVISQAATDPATVGVDQEDPTKVEVITENQDRGISLTIEYTPITDEARFIYSCPSALFDQGAAMNAIKVRAAAFVKERGYSFYTHQRQDVMNASSAQKITTYTSFLLLLGKN